MEECIKVRLIDSVIDTLDKMSGLYFFGIPIEDYIGSKAFFRLQHWLGFGLCGELSVLSMIALKHNKSSRLCQGTYLKADGTNGGFHCWAEFRDGKQEYIADLSWNEFGLTWIAPNKGAYEACYFRESENELLLDDDGKLRVDWSIGYDEFWEYELVKQLYEEMKNPKTSNIFDELTFFFSPEFKNGFLIPKDLRSKQDGRLMVPHFHCDKPLAPVIFKYFYNHPDDKAPSKRIIDQAEHAISVFDRYLKQQGISEI